MTQGERKLTPRPARRGPPRIELSDFGKPGDFGCDIGLLSATLLGALTPLQAVTNMLLAAPSPRTSCSPGMFAVSEAEAAAIRAVYEQSGELSAAVELRRHFPGILSTAARECARIIADWRPLLPRLPDNGAG